MAGEIEVQHHEHCAECGAAMELQVMHSAAGWYLGTECPTPTCDAYGPYGRESEYFSSYEAATNALASWAKGDKVGQRSTDWQPGPMIMHRFDTSQEFEEFTKRYYAGQEEE